MRSSIDKSEIEESLILQTCQVNNVLQLFHPTIDDPGEFEDRELPSAGTG